jgi:hypothetical protein
MGGSKDAMMAWQELVAQARHIAVRSGRLAECSVHGIAYDDDSTLDGKAYAYANIALQKGDIDADREELMAAMEEAIEQAPYECYACQHALNKD